MERDLFATRLAASAEVAWAFARSLVSEDLPERLVFRVRLNQSHDGHAPRPGEMRFPADSAPDRAAALRRCDAATAVAELWREGRVPEWINVAVADETGTETVVELVCCGRFTGDETRLYHVQEGAPPFHVLGPALPPTHDGTPFSIHTRSECWDSTDLKHLAGAADKVWSLDVMTDAFDDDHLRDLPDLPRMELVDHHACTLGQRALSAFARWPKLRVLRLRLPVPSGFQVTAAEDRLDALSSLTITGLPPRPWGHEALAQVAPHATDVSLSATEALWLDGAVGPSVRNLTLSAAALTGPTRLPPHLDHLSVRLSQGTDQHIEHLLDGVTQIDVLSLRGTPVSDAILPLLDRYDPRHLDLVDTAVTAAAISRYRAGHPDTEVLPRERPFTADDLVIWRRER